MPFTRHEGEITIVSQYLRQCSDSFVQVALVSGHTSLWGGREVVGVVLGRGILTRAICPFDEVTKAGDMVVSTCHDPVSVW